jgi:hypothetical protein
LDSAFNPIFSPEAYLAPPDPPGPAASCREPAARELHRACAGSAERVLAVPSPCGLEAAEHGVVAHGGGRVSCSLDVLGQGAAGRGPERLSVQAPVVDLLDDLPAARECGDCQQPGQYQAGFCLGLVLPGVAAVLVVPQAAEFGDVLAQVDECPGLGRPGLPRAAGFIRAPSCTSAYDATTRRPGSSRPPPTYYLNAVLDAVTVGDGGGFRAACRA